MQSLSDIWEALIALIYDLYAILNCLRICMIFADDTDFPSHSKPYLEEAEKIIPVILKKNSLTANGDKWNRQEYSHEEDKW